MQAAQQLSQDERAPWLQLRNSNNHNLPKDEIVYTSSYLKQLRLNSSARERLRSSYPRFRWYFRKTAEKDGICICDFLGDMKIQYSSTIFANGCSYNDRWKNSCWNPRAFVFLKPFKASKRALAIPYLPPTVCKRHSSPPVRRRGQDGSNQTPMDRSNPALREDGLGLTGRDRGTQGWILSWLLRKPKQKQKKILRTIAVYNNLKIKF